MDDSTNANWVGVRRFAEIRDEFLEDARSCNYSFRVWGEVLDWRTISEQYWVTLRDTYLPETLEVRFPRREYVLERGRMINVEGRLVASNRRGEMSVQFRLEGDLKEVGDYAARFKHRRLHVEQLESALAGRGRHFSDAVVETFWVICGEHSAAREDIARAFRKTGNAHYETCQIKDATSVVRAIERVAERAELNHALVLTRGGGPAVELDLFDDELVASALAMATLKVPTLLAVGHARDRLLVHRIVSDVADTPTHAGHKMAQIVRDGRKGRWARDELSPSQPQLNARPPSTSVCYSGKQSRPLSNLFVAIVSLLVGVLIGWYVKSKAPLGSEPTGPPHLQRTEAWTQPAEPAGTAGSDGSLKELSTKRAGVAKQRGRQRSESQTSAPATAAERRARWPNE